MKTVILFLPNGETEEFSNVTIENMTCGVLTFLSPGRDKAALKLQTSLRFTVREEIAGR